LLGSLYAKAYNLDIISTRAFNHIGPGQSPQFVVADFCKQAAEITRGEKEPVIYVGNLGAKRDFTDVRDVVRAYALLGINGKTGETYNVGSGNALEIGVILERILELSDRKIAVQVDSKKFRPVDVPIIVADITKIRQDTGWKAEIPLGQTLKDVFDHFLTGI
jgi:GDP-4-dehydro-6-deoxy-D-mannose reductase